MEIISAKKLIERWGIDYDDLHNKINTIDIPVYVETIDYYTPKVPETRWTRLDPRSVDIETLSHINSPYKFNFEDIKRFEIQKEESLADLFLEKKLPQGLEPDEAISILKGGCNEIMWLYKNLRGVTVNGNENCTTFGKIKVYQSRVKKFAFSTAGSRAGGIPQQSPRPRLPETARVMPQLWAHRFFQSGACVADSCDL